MEKFKQSKNNPDSRKQNKEKKGVMCYKDKDVG